MYQDEGSGRNSSYGGRREGGRRSSYSGSSEPKPVNTGDEIEVKIEAVASKGDGIAKKDGFVIFIKGAKEVMEETTNPHANSPEVVSTVLNAQGERLGRIIRLSLREGPVALRHSA